MNLRNDSNAECGMRNAELACGQSVTDDSTFLQTLRTYYGYDSFRGIQLDIIRSIASGHDTLGLMPTGGGKSITFQVPALTMDGVCLVVTPLISLMHDQVQHLKERGIRADYIHNGLSRPEIIKVLDNAIYGAVKFLYVSPERLSNQLFIAKLHYMKVCFITVDEAHCISQWGYDFRPSYLHIGEIRRLLPHAPVLALTATATPPVMDDIKEKLAFGNAEFRIQNSELSHSNDSAFCIHNSALKKPSHTFRMSFRRDNISYVVRRADDKEAEMLHILRSVEGSAIVYTRSREKTRQVAKMLCEAGLDASYYHAGLDFAIKNRHQQLWQAGEVRVMVATNAFGMGIDKADVRLVIHLDCPSSLEAYFQEAGRAGRDGMRSYAVLLFNAGERASLLRHATLAFPEKEYIRRVYDHLAYYFELAVDTGEGACYEFDEEHFCRTFRHSPAKMQAAIAILQNAGYVNYEPEPEARPRVMFSIGRDELYHIQGLMPAQERVVTTLLRYYGSLFTDLTFIDDQMLARQSGISPEQLHTTLKELSQRRILRYVPRREKPLLSYPRQRIDSAHLRIARDVYEDLEERMLARLDAMLRYAEAEGCCREGMLTEYFGEHSPHPCGHCDVCLGEAKGCNPDYRQRIYTLLSDYQPHSLGELSRLCIPKGPLHQLLEEMRDDPSLHLTGAHISLKRD